MWAPLGRNGHQDNALDRNPFDAVLWIDYENPEEKPPGHQHMAITWAPP